MKKSPKTILVTGPAGFIGSNFVATFKKQFSKTEIVGIDNFSTGRKDRLDKSITFYKGSITDRKFLDKVFKKHKPEYIFHFAAMPRVSVSVEFPVETTENNIVGTVAVLEAAKNHGAQRVIYSSSSSVYGGADQLPTPETTPINPKSPYALQKYVGEPYCKIFSSLFGLDTAVLRYFNVFGPGQFGNSPYSTVMAGWLEALYFPGSKELFLEGDGLQSRDFTYVDNVVQANIKAMLCEKRINGEAFNVAGGERTTLLEVRKLIEQYTGKKLSIEMRPTRIGDVRHSHANISKAKKVLDYKPEVDFKTGLKKTIAWFDSRKK